MAQKIIIKHSNGADAAPVADDLVRGELAVNTVKGALYLKNDIDSIIEIGNNDQAIADLQADIDQNATDIAGNATDIATNVTAISDEEAARIAADGVLQANIDAEAATRLADDTTLQTNIDTEESDRIAADQGLQTAIDNVIIDYTAADSQLSADLTLAFTNADTTQSGILRGEFTDADTALETSLTTAFTDADAVLQVNITSEETARIAADSALQGQISGLGSDKVDKVTTLSTTDTDVLEFVGSDLSTNVELRTKTNGANGLVKLNNLGLVPIDLLPASKTTLLGSFDASSDTNPSSLGLNRGDYYVIAVAGTLQLALTEDPLDIPGDTPVVPADKVIYTGAVVDGGTDKWIYIAGTADTIAAGVLFEGGDSTYITGTTVQLALEQADAALVVVDDLTTGHTAELSGLTTRMDTAEGDIDATEARLDVIESNQVISGDTEMMTVSNPTLSDDVTLEFNTNVPNGVAKIGGDGFLPVSIMPAVQKQLIGSHDASGNALPADPVSAPVGSERGMYYVIELGGTLQLARKDDGDLQPIVVVPGDEITYTGRTGDWFYSKGRSATTATAVEAETTGNTYVSGASVQAALDSIELGFTSVNTGAGNLQDNIDANTDLINDLDDVKADKLVTAVDGNIVTFDENGNIEDTGINAATFATAAQGATADSAIQPGDNISELFNDKLYLVPTSTIDGGTYGPAAV